MSAEEQKAIVRREIEEGWNKGNLAVFDELLAPDFTYRDLSNPTLHDRAGYRKLASTLRTASPDIHYTIEELLVAEGDRLVVRLAFRGTDTSGSGVLGSLPTGKPFAASEILIYRFAGGKIVEEWGLADRSTIMQQLAAVPKQG